MWLGYNYMLRTEIKISPNLSKIIHRLATTQAKTQGLIKDAVKTSALQIVANAKEKCPVMTGALRRSINVRFLVGGLAAVISSYVPYAAKWEFSEVAHPIKPPNSRGKKTGNTNPAAEWGFMRKGLFKESPIFIKKLEAIAEMFAR